MADSKKIEFFNHTQKLSILLNRYGHRLWTPNEEITFTARPRINCHSRIFIYSQSIFCLLHLPKFSDFFDAFLHWVSIVRVPIHSVTVSRFYLLLAPCFSQCFVLTTLWIEKRTLAMYIFQLSSTFENFIEVFWRYLLLYSSRFGSANPGKGGTGKIREEKKRLIQDFAVR